MYNGGEQSRSGFGCWSGADDRRVRQVNGTANFYGLNQ